MARPRLGPNVLCQTILTESVRLQELAQEDLSGMDGRKLRHGGHLLVVVDDLDVERIGGAPDEADAPLVVDADAVLSGPVALERLEAIAGRNAKVGEGVCCIQDHELSKGDALKVGGKTA